MHKENLVREGVPLGKAKRALIMVHGRGATARDILSLAKDLLVDEYALLAPEATNHTWYPHSFLAPPGENEPWLSSALKILGKVVTTAEQHGITRENIYFLGFSQGACLLLDFLARNATRYGGAAAFTGGLIGDKIYHANYAGNFQSMPIFIGTDDPDPHVPVMRVHASAELLREMGAEVTEQIYRGMGHTISEDEIRLANALVFSN